MFPRDAPRNTLGLRVSKLGLLCAYTLRFIQLVATNVITRLGARCDMEGTAPIGAYFPALSPRSRRLMGQIGVLGIFKVLIVTSYKIKEIL